MSTTTTVSAPSVSANRAPNPRARKKASAAHNGNQWIVQALRLLTLVLLIGSWEVLSRTGVINPLYFGKPSEIVPLLAQGIAGDFWADAWVTFYEAMGGFVIGSVLGVLAGLVLTQSKILHDVAGPFIVAFNSMPRIALAPLFIIWFGLGSASRIALGVSLVFFVVLINTLAGAKSADREHLLLARVLGEGRLSTFRKFVLPAAMPSIFAGLQLGLVYAFLAAVVGEMLSGSQGLGGALSLATNTFETDLFFAQLFFLVLLTLAMSQVLKAIEARLLRWKRV